MLQAMSREGHLRSGVGLLSCVLSNIPLYNKRQVIKCFSPMFKIQVGLSLTNADENYFILIIWTQKYILHQKYVYA